MSDLAFNSFTLYVVKACGGNIHELCEKWLVGVENGVGLLNTQSDLLSF
jgi:hypothetical protein